MAVRPSLRAPWQIKLIVLPGREHTFIDYKQRSMNSAKGWRSEVSKRVPNFIRRKGSAFAGTALANKYNRGEKYYSVGDDWEFHLGDLVCLCSTQPLNLVAEVAMLST